MDDLNKITGKYNKTATIVMCIFFGVLIIAFIMSISKNNENSNAQEDPAAIELKNSGVISTDFAAFTKEYDSKTQIQQKEYWETVKGKKVQWSGNVSQVRTGILDNSINVVEVTIGVGETFKAVFPKADTANLSKLNKGDKLTLRGVLSSQGNLLSLWEISDVQIR